MSATDDELRANLRIKLDALQATRDRAIRSETPPIPGTTAAIEPADEVRPTGRTPREKPRKPKQGRGVQFDDPEPWPEPVNGSALLGTFLVAALASHLPEGRHEWRQPATNSKFTISLSGVSPLTSLPMASPPLSPFVRIT
jgi:hypothetical protein